MAPLRRESTAWPPLFSTAWQCSSFRLAPSAPPLPPRPFRPAPSASPLPPRPSRPAPSASPLVPPRAKESSSAPTHGAIMGRTWAQRSPQVRPHVNKTRTAALNLCSFFRVSNTPRPHINKNQNRTRAKTHTRTVVGQVCATGASVSGVSYDTRHLVCLDAHDTRGGGRRWCVCAIEAGQRECIRGGPKQRLASENAHAEAGVSAKQRALNRGWPATHLFVVRWWRRVVGQV